MSIHFVFLTDSHHYPNAPKDYGPPKMLTKSKTVMEAAVPAINAKKPDFIVHGGDLLCGGSAFDLPTETYLKSINEVANVFSGFQTPVFYIPGNHDCDAQSGSFEPFIEKFSISETIQLVEAAPGLRLALANIYPPGCNAIENGNGLWTNELNLSLQNAAEQAAKDHCAILLFLHSWVLPSHEPVSRGLLNGSDLLLKTIKENSAIVALFTGHRHVNRIRMYRDILNIDTACLIGYPMGFREIWLNDNGYFLTQFHRLDLPEIIQASYDRSSLEINQQWEGEVHDRNTEIFLPRLRELWS